MQFLYLIHLYILDIIGLCSLVLFCNHNKKKQIKDNKIYLKTV